MISHSPEVKEKLESFGIPVLVEHSSYENHPLGRTEWLKLYGVLLGKEDMADELFQEQVEKLKTVEDSDNTGKTVAFFYINSIGAANVRKSNDYVSKMIELAGGKYIFDDRSCVLHQKLLLYMHFWPVLYFLWATEKAEAIHGKNLGIWLLRAYIK